MKITKHVSFIFSQLIPMLIEIKVARFAHKVAKWDFLGSFSNTLLPALHILFWWITIKYSTKKHKNLNPREVKRSFDIQLTNITKNFLLLCWLMRYTFIRFGECTTIQQYDHFSAFYTMRNALEEIITWHFMTIVAPPVTSITQFCTTQNHRWKKRKIVECEANKSLADKKSYAVGVLPKAGLQVGRKPFWDHGITTTKMSPNCFHSKKITTPPTGWNEEGEKTGFSSVLIWGVQKAFYRPHFSESGFDRRKWHSTHIYFKLGYNTLYNSVNSAFFGWGTAGTSHLASSIFAVRFGHSSSIFLA